MTLESMNTQISPTARVLLLIRKVWVSGFTWDKIENYFGLNRNTLLGELKDALKCSRNRENALKAFCEKVADNEKSNEIEVCR